MNKSLVLVGPQVITDLAQYLAPLIPILLEINAGVQNQYILTIAEPFLVFLVQQGKIAERNSSFSLSVPFVYSRFADLRRASKVNLPLHWLDVQHLDVPFVVIEVDGIFILAEVSLVSHGQSKDLLVSL